MSADGENYVYGLFRPDTGQIFYVGVGRKDRAWSHSRDRRQGKSHKDNVICKMLDELGYEEIPVVILRGGLTRQEAIDLEIALIYAIGRWPHGPLTNKTAGGEGGMLDPSPDLLERKRAAHRGRKASPTTRAKMSMAAKRNENWRHGQPAAADALRGKARPEETRRKISRALRGRKQDPEVVARRNASVSRAKKGKLTGPQSPELIEKRRQGILLAYASGKRTHRGGMRGRKHSEETKAKMSATHLKIWEMRHG